jgi:transposase, IS5 family
MAEQMSMIEALVDRRLGSNEKLAKIDALIDWTSLETIVGALHQAATGRPAYPALAMLKAVYLQSLYDLSDPGLEEALLDRLSFRRFCGFGLDQTTPDETTICRFRGDAARSHVLERCFAEITRQLEARGLMLKKGTLMDATIVASSHNPLKLKSEKGANHPKEPGAGWINKAGKSYFGYKLHIGVDQGSGLIRKAIFTTAHCQDSEVADGLISGDEKAVYADRAYENKYRRAALKARGIKDRIMHRRHKHLPVLPHWQKQRNKLISKRRAPVEATFSALKRVYGKGRARCHSLLVNAADYFTFAAVYNLRRAVIITS